MTKYFEKKRESNFFLIAVFLPIILYVYILQTFMSSALALAESSLQQATRAIGAAALRNVANHAARRIQSRFRRNKGTNTRKGRRSRREQRRKTRSKGKRLTKKDMSNLTHGGIQKHYHYNSLQYCVTEENKMYNSGRIQITTDPEHHFSDFYRLHDTMTIENNGYNTVTGGVSSADFPGSETTLYSNIDYTHGCGKWTHTGSTLAPESENLSNQIFELRQHYKKWKKDMITFTIQWRSSIDNTHPLSIPQGYYRVIQPIVVKDKLDASGRILGDTALDIDIYRTDVRKLSDTQALQRLYGVPQSAQVFPGSAGRFPNQAAAELLTPPPQELFTYENIARNPQGWKRIPRKRTFTISETYNNPYSLTSKSNIFQDPIVLFVYKEVPPSWLKQTLHTTGTQTNPAYGTPALPTTTFDLETSPEHGVAVVPATTSTIKVAHCYSFKDRAEDIVKIPTNYPHLGDLTPN